MRLFAAVFLIQAVAAFASQIDLALIQFPEPKTAAVKGRIEVRDSETTTAIIARAR